jgi:protein-S-isoprenylcysteine O-methyltransferase Ste14
MYVRLARFEERDAEADFGEHWREYAANTPRFIPQRLRSVEQRSNVK